MSKIIPSEILNKHTEIIINQQNYDIEWEKLKEHCWFNKTSTANYFEFSWVRLYICKYLNCENLTCNADLNNRKCLELIEYEEKECIEIKKHLFRKKERIPYTIKKIKYCEFGRFIEKI